MTWPASAPEPLLGAGLTPPNAPETLSRLDPIDYLGALVAAAAHDVGHDGRNNRFHVVATTPFAQLFNDQHCLENMHCALAFAVGRSQFPVLAQASVEGGIPEQGGSRARADHDPKPLSSRLSWSWAGPSGPKVQFLPGARRGRLPRFPEHRGLGVPEVVELASHFLAVRR